MKSWDCIPEELIPWIQKQEMFFVATAPLTGTGHVNLSPKGLRGSFHIVDQHRVWYEDLSGSGIETISHIRENGRITLMFCAFEGAARIVRLFGRGSVCEFGTPAYDALVPPERRLSGSRAAVVVDVYRAASSCGYAVPMYTFKSQRSALLQWSGKMEQLDAAFAADTASCPSEEVELELELPGDDASSSAPTSDTDELSSNEKTTSTIKKKVYPTRSMKWWWARFNVRSLDGLPGLRAAHLASSVPVPGVLPAGADEPPSDGSVVILGNRVPKAGVAERVRWALGSGLGGEAGRLGMAFSLGVLCAAVWVQVLGRGC